MEGTDDQAGLTGTTAAGGRPRRQVLWAVLGVAALGAGALVAQGVGGGGGGAPRLPIGLGGAGGARAEAAVAADMSMAAWVTYLPGDGLAALGGSARAYVVEPPEDAEVARLAEALGLDGEPERNEFGWELDAGEGGSLNVSGSDGSWWYSAWPTTATAAVAECASSSDGPVECRDVAVDPAVSCGSAAPGSVGAAEPVVDDRPVEDTLPERVPVAPCEPAVDVPAPLVGDPVSPARAEQVARELLDRVAPDLEVRDVRAEPTGGPIAWVAIDVAVDDVPVEGQYWAVSVGPEGQVLDASGSLGTPSPLGTYDLVDTRAAIDRLNGTAFGGSGREVAVLQSAADEVAVEAAGGGSGGSPGAREGSGASSAGSPGIVVEATGTGGATGEGTTAIAPAPPDAGGNLAEPSPPGPTTTTVVTEPEPGGSGEGSPGSEGSGGEPCSAADDEAKARCEALVGPEPCPTVPAAPRPAGGPVDEPGEIVVQTTLVGEAGGTSTGGADPTEPAVAVDPVGPPTTIAPWEGDAVPGCYEPWVPPEPIEIVLREAEVVLILTGSWDGTTSYLVPGYRFTGDDGSRPSVVAVLDEAVTGRVPDGTVPDVPVTDLPAPAPAPTAVPTPAPEPPPDCTTPSGGTSCATVAPPGEPGTKPSPGTVASAVPVEVEPGECGIEPLDGPVPELRWVLDPAAPGGTSVPADLAGRGTLSWTGDARVGTTATYLDESGRELALVAVGAEGATPC
ncbi:MAG: hypothetical protein AB7L84_13125 [Acidimicrobiia bacterium]